MIVDKPFVQYTLPKSRTTQQILNGRKIEKAWNNVCTFLNTCTTAQPGLSSSSSLVAYSANIGDVNAEIAEEIIKNTKRIFGEGQTRPIGYFYPSGLAHTQTQTEWILKSEHLMMAIDYLIQGQPWPKLTFGPLDLVISYNFKLVDPSTKEQLPDQLIDSSLIIWLSRNCICSPNLNFPFPQANIEFHSYLKKIENLLPFKLEAKYLKLGTPNRNGSAYIFRKIAKD